MFSTDGGVTWPDTVNIYDASFQLNSTTDNAESEFHIIPQSVAGNSNVKARFVFDGETEVNPNGSGYYFWQIDDILFVEAPDNDLAIHEVYMQSPASVLPGSPTARSYYERVPAYQLDGEDFSFGGKLSNYGLNAQTNSRIEFFMNGNKVSETQSTTLASGSSDSLGMTTTTSITNPPGNYVMDYVTSGNSTLAFPDNDTIKHDLEVTDSTYCWVGKNQVGDAISFSTISEFALAGTYDIHFQDSISSFEFYVSGMNDSVSHPVVRFVVWDDQFNQVAMTQNISLTPIMHEQWNTFMLPSPVALSPGRYFVGVDVTSGPLFWNQHIKNKAKGFTVRDLKNGGGWAVLDFAGSGVAPAPAIGMNLKGSVCPQLTAQTTVNSPATCGLSDGSATVTPNDPNVSVLWPDGTPGQTHNSLGAGTYNVQLIDGLCVSTVQVTISNQNAPQPANGGIQITKPISAAFINAQEAGDMSLTQDAELTADFTGGSSPFSYVWTTGDTTTTTTLSNVGVGSGYRVTVIDGNSCQGISNPITVEYPDTMKVTIDTMLMANNNIELTAQVQNGTSPYTYEWNDISISTTQSIIVDNSVINTYMVTVTDANGAVAGSTSQTGDEFTTGGCPTISLSFSEVPASCNTADGELTVTAQGGTPPYSYAWSSGGGFDTETGLAGGAYYTVTVTDDNGCTAVDSASVSDAGAPDVTLNIDNEIDCFGDSDGQVSAAVTGGQAPYFYNWSNNSTGNTLNNVPAGTYSVTVTDNSNCSAVESITLNEPAQLDTGVTITGNGTTAEASLDTAGVSYTWYNCGTNTVVSGENSKTFTPANDGSYRLIVELDGCTDSSSCYNLITTNVGERTADEFNMNIYPNPNSGLFSVRLTGHSNKDVQLQVLDIQGKQLMNRNLGKLSGEYTEELNLNLAGGIYLIKVIHDDQVSIDRLVIQ